MGSLPVLVGAVQLMVAEVELNEADTPVGAPGAVVVVNLLGVDSLPSPTALRAFTVKLCSLPLDNPVILQPVEPEVAVQLLPSGCSYTVYPVIEDPPSESGVVHLMVAWVPSVPPLLPPS